MIRTLFFVKRQSGKGSGKNILSVSFLLLISSLFIASVYLFIKYRRGLETVSTPAVPVEKEKVVSDEVSAWKTYLDKAYGYTIKYPPLLVPREAEDSVYLRFVVFLSAEGTGESGFALSVRDTVLDAEASLIKEEIQKDVLGRLVREGEIVKDGFSGVRLEYEPEEPGEAESRTVVILNNGQYSYTISAHPSQIDKILDNFDLID